METDLLDLEVLLQGQSGIIFIGQGGKPHLANVHAVQVLWIESSELPIQTLISIKVTYTKIIKKSYSKVPKDGQESIFVHAALRTWGF